MFDLSKKLTKKFLAKKLFSQLKFQKVPENSLFLGKTIFSVLFKQAKLTFLKSVWKGEFFYTQIDLLK